MPISYRDKLKLYREALNEGVINEFDDPLEYTAMVESYMDSNPVRKTEEKEAEPVKTLPNMPTEILAEATPIATPTVATTSPTPEARPSVEYKFDYELSPAELREQFRTMEGADYAEVARQFNLGEYPFEAVSYKTDTGEAIGFTTPIDRYEMAYDVYKQPVYLRYLKNVDQPEVLSRDEFEKEKFFNVLPTSVKRQYTRVIY